MGTTGERPDPPFGADARYLAAGGTDPSTGPISWTAVPRIRSSSATSAAFNDVPDPVFHLTARAMGIVTGLAAVEPDPAAPDRDALLDAALVAATALAQLLGFRRACFTATTAADQAEATAKLTESAAGFTRAAEAVTGLLDLARLTAASGRRGKQDLN